MKSGQEEFCEVDTIQDTAIESSSSFKDFQFGSWLYVKFNLLSNMARGTLEYKRCGFELW
jgi:hypothetical protein